MAGPHCHCEVPSLLEWLEPRLLLSREPLLGDLAALAGAGAGDYWPSASEVYREVADFGDTFAAAEVIGLSRRDTLRVTGRLEGAGDVDVLALVAPASGTVQASLNVAKAAYLGQISVYDAGGNLLGVSAETRKEDASLAFDVVGSQVYYIRIAGLNAGQAHYTLALDLERGPGPVNHAPEALDDAYLLDEDTTLAGAVGVLANDADADGDALSAVLVDDVASGVLVLNADGTFTYTPHADYSGTDRFTYRAGDGQAESDLATVVLEVRPVNDAPVSVNDLFEVDEDQTLEAGDVLANDLDADGDVLTVELVADVTSGTLVLNPDGTFSYTPAPNFDGEDVFRYRVSDNQATSLVAEVRLVVQPVNDAPAARDDAFTMGAGQTLGLAPAGVLANDLDADGDALSVLVVDGPQHGALGLDAGGGLVYTPDAGFVGTDVLTYRASDGQAESNLATVTITVLGSNQAPVAHDDAYTVTAGGVLTVASPGVLANDTDADGDPLTAMLVSNVSNGWLFRDPQGGFTYVPNAGFTGIDSFTYKAADQDVYSNVATVTIYVLPALA